MTRRRLFLMAACLVVTSTCATFAWTQQNPPTESSKGQSIAPQVQKNSSQLTPVNNNPFVLQRFEGGGARVVTGSPVVALPATNMRTRVVSETVTRTVFEPIPADELQDHQQFQETLQFLKEAKDDESKRKATETLQQHLVKQFDRDVADRENELVKVEERLKMLRQQLEKRKATKDEIVSLRLKTIINSAEGLGFPGEGVQEGVAPILNGVNSALPGKISAPAHGRGLGVGVGSGRLGFATTTDLPASVEVIRPGVVSESLSNGASSFYVGTNR